MDVISVSPFRAGSVQWQPRRGAFSLTVVCKGTFRLVPGEATLAEDQEFPNEDDNHWNDDQARSLYAPSDFAPLKRRADVLLVGHGFAPDGEPVRSLLVWLVAGKVDKEIEVFGERSFTPDGRLLDGTTFTKMPLWYERAAGGPETQNPVGVRSGEAARGDIYGYVPLPNLVPPSQRAAERGTLIEPIGFGPVAPTWPARRRLLGAHADRFASHGWHEAPLPEDFDFGYFNAAPPDQQVEQISDMERIVLQNLHPELPRLVTTLPGLHPRVFVQRGRAAPKGVAMKCDTLWIDTDRGICTLTWRGQVALEAPGEAGRVLVAMEKGGQRLDFEEVEALAAHGIAEEPTFDPEPLSVDLPDVGPETAPAPPAAVAAPAPPLWTPAPGPIGLTTTRLAAFRPDEAVLPFQKTGDPGSTLRSAASGSPVFSAPSPIFSSPSPVFSTPGGAGLAQPASPPGALGAELVVPPARGLRHPAVTEIGLEHAAPRTGGAPSWLSTAPLPALPGQASGVPPPMGQALGPVPPLMGQALGPVPPPMGQTSGPVPPPLLGHVPAPAVVTLPPATAAMAPAFLGPMAPSPGGPIARPAPVAPPVPLGTVEASNAAAKPAVVELPPPRAGADAHTFSNAAPAEALQLLWFEPASMARVREAWRSLLTGLDPLPGGKREKPADPKEPAREDDAIELDLLGILGSGRPTPAADLDDVMAAAVGPRSGFRPPLALLAGELRFPFDELETLKATVIAATPLAAADKKLREVLDAVNEVLRAAPLPGSGGVAEKGAPLPGSGGIAEKLAQRIRETFAQGNRTLPAGYLEAQTDRMLLEQRCYQRRTVLGDAWIRALFSTAGGEGALPAYLPVALAKVLPMFPSMKVRLLAEAHPQQDRYEEHAAALRVVALGRVLGLRRRLGAK